MHYLADGNYKTALLAIVNEDPPAVLAVQARVSEMGTPMTGTPCKTC